MRVCSTLQEFDNVLKNYQTSDAEINIKEDAICKLFELNQKLLNAPRIDTGCSIMLDEID